MMKYVNKILFQPPTIEKRNKYMQSIPQDEIKTESGILQIQIQETIPLLSVYDLNTLETKNSNHHSKTKPTLTFILAYFHGYIDDISTSYSYASRMKDKIKQHLHNGFFDKYKEIILKIYLFNYPDTDSIDQTVIYHWSCNVARILENAEDYRTENKLCFYSHTIGTLMAAKVMMYIRYKVDYIYFQAPYLSVYDEIMGKTPLINYVLKPFFFNEYCDLENHIKRYKDGTYINVDIASRDDKSTEKEDRFKSLFKSGYINCLNIKDIHDIEFCCTKEIDSTTAIICNYFFT